MQARLVLAAIAAGALFLIGSCSSDPPQQSGDGGDSGCPQGQQQCATGCSTPATDNQNCGQCGIACPPGTSCSNGTCACQGTLLSCNQQCIDPVTDVTNCGQCGNNCGSNAFCNARNCACLEGHNVCGTGTAAHCVNVQTDVTNCGTCGIVCPATAPFCQAGMCSATCNLTVCTNACVDTMTDPANCGGCGQACPQGQSCSAGVCGCAGGLMSCNNVCVDVTSNPVNCGTCGRTCAGGQTCSGGQCICTPPQILCNGVCADPTSPTCGAGGQGGTGGAGAGGMTGGVGGQGGTGGAGQGGTGGGGQGGTAGGSGGRPTGCPAPTALLSDFEEGPQARLVPSEGRDGWWYVFGQTGGSQTPPNVVGGPIMAQLLSPQEGNCNRYALHSTATGKPQYSGFGATMHPTGTAANAKGPVSVANYTGISFRIRSGSGSHAGVFFEFLNRETQPGPNCSTCGANSDLGGSATNNAIDAYNTRGRRLPTINTAGSMMGAQQITVPFGTLAPRYLPSVPTCASNVFCEAPAFNPASVLGIQISVYDQFGTSGGYDLWVDDVTFTTGDAGLPTHAQTAGAMHPFPRDAAIPNCTKPTGAAGKFLIEAYQTWKQTFVDPNPGAGLTPAPPSGGYRIKRPEANNDTVSEGIAYGMLIAVYMNDKNLFDGLWTYWKRFPTGGNLMHWQINSGGGVQGMGSATDADEDAAFALIMAARQWGGGSYMSDATSMIGNIWTNDMMSGSGVKPGNNFSDASVTNPSYFAPAFYRVFQTVGGQNWNNIITWVYDKLDNSGVVGTTGLVPAWCGNTCTSAGDPQNRWTDHDKYQYDSHRTPWRIGMDACWNNNAQARTYIGLTTAFFHGQSDNEGLGGLADMYYTNGSKFGTKANSMSLIGTAASGAMASTNTAHRAFVDRGYRFILDAMYTPDPMTRMTAYTYYNATVGLLAALTMSGNFNNW